MIRNACTILVGSLLCFLAPIVAGLLIAVAKTPDVVVVIILCAGGMSASGMRWIFQDGKTAAAQRLMGKR